MSDQELQKYQAEVEAVKQWWKVRTRRIRLVRLVVTHADIWILCHRSCP